MKRKHTNTKHCDEELLKYKTKQEYMTEKQDFFQIEIVDGETVYVCNVCYDGFYQTEELNEHIEL